MATARRYTCDALMVATIEAAFAAHGYQIKRRPIADDEPQRVIMMRRNSLALLVWQPSTIIAELIIWDDSASTTAPLLESLPVVLHSATDGQGKDS